MDGCVASKQFITLGVAATAVANHDRTIPLVEHLGCLLGRSELLNFDSSKAAKIATWLGVGINAVILWNVGRAWYRSTCQKREKQRATEEFIDRLWQVAVIGFDALGGAVPADLGEPDEYGVYSQVSGTGTVYYRLSPAVQPGPHTWQWSLDKHFWIPTSAADAFSYSPDQRPSPSDKVLIQRLEVESQLARRADQGATPPLPATPLPPLDPACCKRADPARLERDAPDCFLCPISMRLMLDPVVSPGGLTFERATILDWIERIGTDPATGQPLRAEHLYQNLTLRDMIQAWLVGEH